MTPSRDLEDRLTSLLEAKAAARAPDELLTRTLAGTARDRRRPGWRIPERWLPMSIALRPAVLPRAVPLFALLAALTLLVLVAAIIGVGSAPRDDRRAAVPPFTGPARNGLIAYDAYGDIWVMNPDGTDRQQLTSGPSLDIGPTWSPDGSLLAYVAYPNEADVNHVPSEYSALLRQVLSGQASLMVMKADGSEATSLGEPGLSLTFGWAPDSRRLAYAHAPSVGATSMISVVSVDDPDSIDVATGDAGPTWSPDGESIAFRGLPGDPSGGGIYLAASDGSDFTRCATPPADTCRRLTQVTGDVNAFGNPQWFPAPESDRIATYAGGTSAAGHDILIVNADGSGESNITNTNGDEYYPAWSPAGDRLAFDRQVDQAHNLIEIVISNVDGSEAVALESEPLFGMLPLWSPDGTMLVGQLPAEVTAGWQWDAASDLVIFAATPGAATPPRLIPVEGAYGQESWQRLGPDS